MVCVSIVADDAHGTFCRGALGRGRWFRCSHYPQEEPTMRKTLPVLLIALLLAACATAAPRSLNESIAYAGATLNALQQTASQERPYMTDETAHKVNSLLDRAVQYRHSAVLFSRSLQPGKARTKLQKLQVLLTKLQQILQKEVQHER